jgi:hypothetical protein
MQPASDTGPDKPKGAFRERWWLVGCVLLAATLLGLLFCLQVYLSAAAMRHPVSWGQAIYWAFGDWYEWALLSPAIFWLCQRYRLDRSSWAMNLSVFLVSWGLFMSIGVVAQTSGDPPRFILQPRGQSVSLGAKVTFRVSFTGTPTPNLQWRWNETPLTEATQSTLILTNVTSAQAGRYDAVAWNDIGSVTSTVAVLIVDTAFTKITDGPIATNGGDSSGVAWGDMDNDGFPDLFIGNGGSRNYLYHNSGDGTFTALTNSAPALDSGFGGSWGDYDNDGHLDLFVANRSINLLYHNNGDGTFTKVKSFAGAVGSGSWSGSWGDYDRDGWLDLFISNGSGHNALLHNNGDGTFTRIATGSIVRDGGNSIGAAWQDYDRDGWPDLYVANNGGPSFLYRNLGVGLFQRVTNGAIATAIQSALVADWGDYDNDGWPDLAVGCSGHNLLFHNQGNGGLNPVTEGALVRDIQNSEIVQWIDYDNDGELDLFSANDGGQNNTLYRDNGDGTFTRILTGSLVNDGGNSAGCAWADFDDNGFLDLCVANWHGSRPNFLYRNNGNSNHWLKVRCIGTASNRSGVGAKVWVTTTVSGREERQLREISGGTGFGQTSLLAHFGLGQADLVDNVRIEWPSGTIQDLARPAVDQTLTVLEPPKLEAPASANGSFVANVIGLAGVSYIIECSDNLRDWLPVTVLTNVSRSMPFSIPLNPKGALGFYRVRAP